MKSTAQKTNPGTVTRVAASLAILSILSLQAFTAIFYRACSLPIPFLCRLSKEPDLYPFLNYAMYSDIHSEGVSVNQHTLIATFKDGTEKQLGAEDFALSLYQFNTGIVVAIQNDDRIKVKQYIEAYNQTGEQPFVALRLETHPWKITQNGVLEETHQIVTSIATDPDRK